MLHKNGFEGPFIIEREIPDGNQEAEINKTLNLVKEQWNNL